MAVHRSLPQRDLPLVGAWCFLDRFGPQVTRMRVEPHPHIGLQTVTWPFVGEVRHRDTIGSDVVVRRGALNLMTSGEGIAHSEYSVGEDAVPLDALQLWVALPESRRHGAPAFERHEDLPVVDARRRSTGQPGEATVVLGELARCRVAGDRLHADRRCRDAASPRAPACGCRSTRRGSTRSSASRAIVDVGDRHAADRRGRRPSTPQHLLYLGVRPRRRRGHERRRRDRSSSSAVSRSRTTSSCGGTSSAARTRRSSRPARRGRRHARFGHVVDHGDERIPAPPMPAVRLTRRRRRV